MVCGLHMSTDFHIRIDDELLAKLREYCREREIGVGKLVCGLIEGKVGEVVVESKPVPEKVKVHPVVPKPVPIEVPESEERVVYSECCEAELVRNARNLLSCKKCGAVIK